MNLIPVNTLINIESKNFDTFNKSFLPKEGSFDFINRQSYPQDFVDAIQTILESTQKNDHKYDFLGGISDEQDQKQHKLFHSRVLQFLMIFGLSFCKTDLLDYSKLKTPKEILEEDFLVALDETSPDKKEYFSKDLPETIEMLKATLRSVIFLFNVQGDLRLFTVDNGYLSKAPIIVVYSKTQALLLYPTSFSYYSQCLITKNVTDSTKKNFFSICHYRLEDDHWIPHTNQREIYMICKAVYKLGHPDVKDEDIPIRTDFLSFDFASYIQSKLVIVGLIGHCTDVFHQMNLKVNTRSDKHEESFPKGFTPHNRISPEIVFYIPENDENDKNDENDDEEEDSKSKVPVAYIFLYTPYINPIANSRVPSSPMSPTYAEATSDAYMKMKTLCSKVLIVTRNEGDAYQDEDKILFLSHRRYIMGNDLKRQKKPYENFVFGSCETANYVNIRSNTISSNDNKIIFESLRHFLRWIEWKSRIYNISFELQKTFNKSEIMILDEHLDIKKQKKLMFHMRTERTKANCEISADVFKIISHFLLKGMQKNHSNGDNIITIKEIIAFEDGQLEMVINMKSEEKQNNYKFYKISSSKTKILTPCYFNKIVYLKDIEENFELINSWFVENRILLTLFYSKEEKKVHVIPIHQNFSDRTPPAPIISIDSDYEDQRESLVQTSKYYSSYNSNARLLIFTVVQEQKSKLVRVFLDSSFTGFSGYTTVNIDNFAPLEAKDDSFNRENCPIDSIFDLPKSTKVFFTGFAINDNGNSVVMCFNCYIEISPNPNNNNDKNNNNNEKIKEEKGRYQYYVFFNPNNLTPTSTFKVPSYGPPYHIDSLNAPLCVYPIAFINNRILIYSYEAKKDSTINKVAIVSSNTIVEENDIIPSQSFPFPDETSNFFLFSKQQHLISLIHPGDEYLLAMYDGKSANSSVFTIKTIYFNQIPLLFYLNPHVNSSEKFDFNALDYTQYKSNFDCESLAQLVIQTDERYGNGIIEQMMISEPNKVSLHLSIVNSIKVDDHSNQEETELEDLIAFRNLAQMHLFEIDVNKDDIINGWNLHNSPERFIIELLSSVRIVVNGPIVDLATMDIFRANADLLKNEVQNMNNLKSTMQLCYMLRSRKFPGFPFLRMTTKFRIFHISVIGEEDSGSNCLLSWLIGKNFSIMRNNTLAIGSNAFPVLMQKHSIFDDNKRIRESVVDEFINVVGSLFTVKEGTFTQVVGFIAALSASDTVVIEFKDFANVLKFFRIFFDCADSICSEFELKFSQFVSDSDQNEKVTIDNDKFRNIKVVVFCNFTFNSENTSRDLEKEVYKIIEERSLDLSNSIAVQIIKNISFNFSTQTTETYAKAMKLKECGMLNIQDSENLTKDLIDPIRNMALIFGQQIDHDANLSCFASSSVFANRFKGFIPKDDDAAALDNLIGIANFLLKKNPDDRQYKELAKKLLQEAESRGSKDAQEILSKIKF